MLEYRFQTFITNIAQISKNIQKIKNKEMLSFGLRGTHVMCLFYLQNNPGGLTAAELSKLCELDKAAISRSVSELEELEYVTYQIKDDSKKYRAKIILTERGMWLTEKIDAIIEDSVNKAGMGLNDAERAYFYKALTLISKNLQKMAL